MSDNVLTLRPGTLVLTTAKREDGMTQVTLRNTRGRTSIMCYLTEEESSQLADHLRSEYVEPWKEARVVRVTGCTDFSVLFFRTNTGAYVSETGLYHTAEAITALGGKIEVALQ